MKTILKVTLAIIYVMANQVLNAQDFKGSWKGAISTKGIEIEMIFNIDEENGEYSSSLDVPMQGATDLKLDKTELDGNTIRIRSAKLQLDFIGTLNNGEISGTYNQAGQSFPLDMIKIIKTLPGNITLPTSADELLKIANLETGEYKYTVEDYFRNPEAYSFKLSPNGKFISYMKRDEEGKNNLFIKNIESETEKMIVKEGEDVIKGYFWATNSRLLYLEDKGGNENFHVFGVDIDGQNKKELTPFDDVKVSILSALKNDKDHIIVSMNKDSRKQEEPYRLNVLTGEIEKLYSYKEGELPILSYDFDKDGDLRLISRLINGVETKIDYKLNGEFIELMTVEFGSGFGVISFNYQTDYPHDAYVVSNLKSDKTEIQLYDLKEKKVIKTIFSNETYDVSSANFSRKRNYELDYITYVGEKVNIIPISETYTKVNARLKAEFGEREFYATSRSEDENIYMVIVTSDKIIGEYYTYNVEKDEVKKLYKLLPHLKEDDMAIMKPIKFTSRDGLTIYGYVTLPKVAENGKKVPLVVMPHGGPQGVRDSWGFIQENQLFASRGYATLNINFRISGGYGKSFMMAGFNEIGRKAMDDVEDGIAYVIEQGWVDKSKIAIFGASHGGYAVLRGLTKTPDLYACGVDYVGVSNLNTFMETIPAYWEKYRDFLYRTWYNPNIPEQKEIMNEISPALHTDLIKKPLFVVQGANDPRVNINEADQIVEKLRARNITVPYMVKYDEGHGFYKEENRIELYKTMMGFFAQNLK